MVWLAVSSLRTAAPPLRDRELEELRERYTRVVDGRFPDGDAIERALEALFDALDYELREPLRQCLRRVVADEAFESPPDFAALDLKQQIELKKRLAAWELKGIDGQDLLETVLLDVFLDLGQHLPKTRAPSPFTVPLIYVVPDVRAWITRLYATLSDEKYRERELFETLRTQLYFNACRASDIEPYTETRKKIRHAYQSDLPLDELNWTYLRGTPFYDFFRSPVPLKVTHEDRFNHWHVLAGSGQGKTVLIENVIRHDLASEAPPSIVLIDPHSDLVRTLVRSDLGIEDLIILIDPRDTKHPVALNPFAVNRERFERYDEATKEQVTAGVLQTFGYLWSGLTNLTLTGKQDVFFRYVTRLMLMLPEVEGRNATILDMLKLMSDPVPYGPAIEALPDIPRDFFMRDFMSKSFEGTKEQVRYRLQAIIESPTMARVFTAPETKIDFFTEMNRGAVILVDTAKDFLKEGSAVFGKLIISLILQAVLERAAIPESARKPTFVMVDEAASYFSSNIDDLLTEARKYKCGLLLAHQYLDQASSSLRASLAANAAIKFASGLSAQDAATMAREMRTTSDFILAQPKLHFAAHIRGVTPTAVEIPVWPVKQPAQLSREAMEQLHARNRARVSLSVSERPLLAAPAPRSDVSAGEDISANW